MPTPKVMIASPTRGAVKTVNEKSVIATMVDLLNHGITSQFETEDGSDIALQRSVLGSRLLASDCTHVFFDDSDMMHSETLCREMLHRDKPFIGTVCAGKQFNASSIEKWVREGYTFSEAILLAHNWTYFPIEGQQQVVVENGLTEVDRCGFGVVLLRREVFEIMIREGVVQPQILRPAHLQPFHNFFMARAADANLGQHKGEDTAFCNRWRIDCGRKIWAYIDTPIFHIGDFAYGGNYFEVLKAMERKQQAESSKQKIMP